VTRRALPIRSAPPARTIRTAVAPKMPDHVRLAARDRDRQRLTLDGPELDHVGAVVLRAEDHDPVLAGYGHRAERCLSCSGQYREQST